MCLAVTFVSLWTLVGCSSRECARLERSYGQVVASQAEALVGEVPAQAPVAMAVQLRQGLLQGWLQQALQQEGGQIKLTRRLSSRDLGAAGALLGKAKGALQAELRLKRVTASLSPEGCGQPLCLELELSSSLRLSGELGGKKLFQTATSVRTRGVAPLRLDNQPDRAELRLDLSQVELSKVELPLEQLPEALRPRAQAMLGQAAQGLLQLAGRELTLASWRPWSLEGTQVKLKASSLRQVSAEVLEVGFASNLPLGQAPALPSSQALGPDEQVALRFSQGALLGLMRQWMQLPGAPTRLNEDFKPDPEGIHRISLEQLSATPEALQLEVTLWRVARQEQETCYAARARGDAMFHVKRGGRVQLKLQDLELVESQGEDTLLRLGLWARSLFFSQGLAAQAQVLAARTLQLGPLGEQTWEVRRLQGEQGAVTVVVGQRQGP